MHFSIRLSYSFLFLIFSNVPYLSSVHLEDYSFITPFQKGSSQLEDNWTYGLTTRKEQFLVRLTSDRLNEHGYLGTKQHYPYSLYNNSFSMITTLRISGKHVDNYGCGLGLFFLSNDASVQTSSNQLQTYTPSPDFLDHSIGKLNYGAYSKYSGIGVILNTNSEKKATEYDLFLQLNNGYNTYTYPPKAEDMKIGCQLPSLRYNENDPSFDPVFNLTRIKVEFKEYHVLLSVDTENKGKWQVCVNTTLNPNLLPRNWVVTPPYKDVLVQTNDNIDLMKDAKDTKEGASTTEIQRVVDEDKADQKNGFYVLMTSYTTAVASDNYDILRVSVYNSTQDHEFLSYDRESKIQSLSQNYMKWFYYDTCQTECKLNILYRLMLNYRMEYEYYIQNLREKILQNVEKLKAYDSVKHQHMIEIGRSLDRMTDRHVNNQIENLKTQVHSALHETLIKKLSVFDGMGAAWKITYFLFLVALAGCGYIIYKKYYELKKAHFL